LEWRFVFSDDDTVSDDRDVESDEILEEINKHLNHKTIPKKCAKVIAVHTVTAEMKPGEDVEIFPQSTADRHALLSNYMSSWEKYGSVDQENNEDIRLRKEMVLTRKRQKIRTSLCFVW
jgi:hypothetical protein